MTRGKKLLALTGVLLMVIAAIAAVKLAAETEQEVLAETLYALDFDTTDVIELAWQTGDSAFTFAVEAGSWVYPADESFPVSGNSVSALLDALAMVEVEKTVEGSAADFGLEAPACVITLTGEAVHTVTIGDESAMGGQRYLTVDDSPVYLVDDGILGDFTCELYDFLKVESIPSMKNITSLTVERKGADLVLKQETDEDGNAVWHGLVKGEEFDLDTKLVNSFLDTVTTMYWARAVEHNATDQQLKGYGLAKPTATLTVNYQVTTQTSTDLTDSDGVTIMDTVTTDHTFVLELGSVTSEGVYARLADSRMVYELYESYSYELLNITIEDLLPTEE